MSTEERDAVSRRNFLRAATGAAAATAAAGRAAAQDGGNETATGNESTATAGGNETSGGNQSSGGNQTSGGGGGGGGTKEVTVGPGGNPVFEPAELEIQPGTTVKWTWDSDNHNIVVDSQPDGTDWGGTEGSKSETYNSGHEYSHAFDTEGDYAYFCQPHVGTGMEGTITVSKDAGQDSGGGGGPPPVPDSARTLGVASLIGMASTLGLTFFFLKYGGDYETGE